MRNNICVETTAEKERSVQCEGKCERFDSLVMKT